MADAWRETLIAMSNASNLECARGWAPWLFVVQPSGSLIDPDSAEAREWRRQHAAEAFDLDNPMQGRRVARRPVQVGKAEIHVQRTPDKSQVFVGWKQVHDSGDYRYNRVAKRPGTPGDVQVWSDDIKFMVYAPQKIIVIAVSPSNETRVSDEVITGAGETVAITWDNMKPYVEEQ